MSQDLEASAAAEAINIAERLELVATHLRSCAKHSAETLVACPGYMRHWSSALEDVAA